MGIRRIGNKNAAKNEYGVEIGISNVMVIGVKKREWESYYSRTPVAQMYHRCTRTTYKQAN